MACFFFYYYYYVLKMISVQCSKEKKEFKFIKFRRILKPSKTPRLICLRMSKRCLGMSKNATNEVGP